MGMEVMKRFSSFVLFRNQRWPLSITWLSIVAILFVAICIEALRRIGINVPTPFLLIYACVILTTSVGSYRVGIFSAIIGAGFIIFATFAGYGAYSLIGRWFQAILSIILLLLTAYQLGNIKAAHQRFLCKILRYQTTLEILVAQQTEALEVSNRTLLSEVSERKRIESDLQKCQDNLEMMAEAHVSEMQTALANAKTLQDLLSICAWCKRIRDDDGYWQCLETYLVAHAEVSFTHCICSNCRDQVLSNIQGAENDNPLTE